MSYESPITQIVNDIQYQLEEDCIKVVQSYGFDVDKEELKKALVYDRNQFEKGYKHGRADAIDEIVKLMKPCNNCPSYPNECNDTDYFEDCCRTEQSISWEDLRKLAEELKEQNK